MRESYSSNKIEIKNEAPENILFESTFLFSSMFI